MDDIKVQSGCGCCGSVTPPKKDASEVIDELLLAGKPVDQPEPERSYEDVASRYRDK